MVRRTFKDFSSKYTVTMVGWRRPRNVKNELSRAKVKRENDIEKGTRKRSKSRCQICTFDGNRAYFINFCFDCDSAEVVYILSSEICRKFYAGSTTTSFMKAFEYHENSVTRYCEGQRVIPGEESYVHSLEPGHNGIDDMLVKIIEKIDVSERIREE